MPPPSNPPSPQISTENGRGIKKMVENIPSVSSPINGKNSNWDWRGETMNITVTFGSTVYNQSKVYIHQNFLKVVVHVIIIDQWNQTALFYEIQVMIIQSNLIILKSKGLSEILRDNRTSTYQICKI